MKYLRVLIVLAILSVFALLLGTVFAKPGSNNLTPNTGPPPGAISATFVDPPFDLEVGTTESLVCSFSPENTADKSLLWESSDPEVLSVDSNGVVEALSVGRAVITATAVNGARAECNILVYKESVFSYIIIIAFVVGLFIFIRAKKLGRYKPRKQRGPWHEDQ